MMSMAQLNLSKGVYLPPITTQSSPHYFSTTRTTFRNWQTKIGQKLIATNPFWTNGQWDLLRNDRQWLPSLAHQKTMWISPEMLRSPWPCSDLKRTRCRIWRIRNIFSLGMASLPLWCNSKRRTKGINWWRKNSRPCHQCQQGSLWFLFSVSFHCTILFSLPYPRTWASPKK